MGDCAVALQDGFVEPTEESLDDLGPGCFVQKKESGGSCCWVEIVSMDDTGYECIAHPALLNGENDGDVSEGDVVSLKRDQITALGCDRYCFC